MSTGQPTAAQQGLAALMQGLPQYSTEPGVPTINASGKAITADPLAGVKFERNMTEEERAAELADAAEAGAAPAFNWAAHQAAQAAKKNSGAGGGGGAAGAGTKKGGVRRKKRISRRKRHSRRR